MNYGLENFIFYPPMGAITSLFMIFGLDALGLFIFKFLKFDLTEKKEFWLRCQSPLVGAAVLLSIASPIVLVGLFTSAVPTIIGSILGLLGLKHSIVYFSRWYTKGLVATFNIKEFKLIDWAIIFILFGFTLLAMAPATEADALDYHIGTAIDILNTGAFPFRPEWFHSRLIGSGEILIAIGLSVGAEQFSSLLQLLGLACVVSIFLTKPGTVLNERKWLALTAVSTPCLLALVSTAKPLLLPCAMTTSALMILHFNLTDDLSRKSKKYIAKSYFLICILAMTAATMKANFMLSGALVAGLALVPILKTKNWKLGIGFSFSMIFITVFPFLLWKYTYFDGTGVFDFFTVFPGDWPGYNNFKTELIDYRSNPKVAFPFSVIFPTGFGSVTLILGVGVFYLFSFLQAKNFVSRYIVIASLSLLTGYAALGQHDSRFFLEPYLWILLAYNFRGINLKPTFYLTSKLYKSAIATQALGTFLMVSYGAIYLFPGALSMEWRKSVMMNAAQGYDVMMWADRVLPKDAVIISAHRSIGLSPRKTIPIDWYPFVKDNQDGIDTYLSLIALNHPTFFLFRSEKKLESEKIPEVKIQIPCIGKVYAGPFSVKTRTRNPFYIRDNMYRSYVVDYNVWIRHFDVECLKSKKDNEI
jgi:hypothetical protein